jgi:CRP-like cAMP-binding protein
MDDREYSRLTPLPDVPPDDTSPASGDGKAAATGAVVRHEGAAAAHAEEPNRLLRSLPLEEYERLLLQLTPVRLRLKQALVEPDVPITHVYFVREGVGSMIATEQEGGDIEVGTVGNEGLIGLPVLHGADTMPYRVMVQVEGDAWRLSADAFRRAVDERPAVRRVCLRYAQYFADQLAQAVACNRLHTLEERCARWLLMTHDRVYGDTFEITHEFLALMLGVRRAGVSVAMGTLQNAGILQYARGRVVVLDRMRLEEASCGCYHITRSALDRLLG